MPLARTPPLLAGADASITAAATVAAFSGIDEIFPVARQERRACVCVAPARPANAHRHAGSRAFIVQTDGRSGFATIYTKSVCARARVYTFRRKIIIKRDRLHIYILYIFRIYYVYGARLRHAFRLPPPPHYNTNPKSPPTSLDDFTTSPVCDVF